MASINFDEDIQESDVRQAMLLRHSFSFSKFESFCSNECKIVQFPMPKEIIDHPELVWSFRVEKIQFFNTSSSNNASKSSIEICKRHQKENCHAFNCVTIFTNVTKANYLDPITKLDKDKIFYLTKLPFRECKNYSFSLKTKWQEFDAVNFDFKLVLGFLKPVVQTKGCFEVKFKSFDVLFFKNQFEHLEKRPSLETSVFFKPVPGYPYEICFSPLHCNCSKCIPLDKKIDQFLNSVRATFN